jgi:probable phosphoglycerate mutase
MQLILIRHARPARVHLAGAGADPGLTEDGHRQAALLAQYLVVSEHRPHAVYASPMRRARDTAEPLAKLAGVEVTYEEELAEFDRDNPVYIPNEEYEGDRYQQWQDLLRGYWHGNWFDLAAFRKTVFEAVEGIIAKHQRGSVAVVCHSGVINAYLAETLGTRDPMFFQPDYTSVTRVRVGGNGLRLLTSANETVHLHAQVATLASPEDSALPGGPP